MYKVFDSDDFGCNHVISEMCQSHDCRDILTSLHQANPNFKATLFAIPGEMTLELNQWAYNNQSWIELAVHGLFHGSNYECSDLSYEDFDLAMTSMKRREIITEPFVRGFKAPGWQISDDIYRWLSDNDFWVADQGYNDSRRPKELAAYVNYNGNFTAFTKDDTIPPLEVDASHHHTWNCMGNGVYEQFDQILEWVGDHKDFKFISEVL